jgi:hypothetical protein
MHKRAAPSGRYWDHNNRSASSSADIRFAPAASRVTGKETAGAFFFWAVDSVLSHASGILSHASGINTITGAFDSYQPVSCGYTAQSGPTRTNNIILATTHTVTRASRGTRRSNPGQLSTIRRRLPGFLLSDVALATAPVDPRLELPSPTAMLEPSECATAHRRSITSRTEAIPTPNTRAYSQRQWVVSGGIAN